MYRLNKTTVDNSFKLFIISGDLVKTFCEKMTVEMIYSFDVSYPPNQCTLQLHGEFLGQYTFQT